MNGKKAVYQFDQRPVVHVRSDAEMPQTFEPMEFPCKFIEQFLPFVLLGQRDFLRRFQYAQDGHAGWFSLEQIRLPD